MANLVNSGAFTAPIYGVYFFTFTATTATENVVVKLRKNGEYDGTFLDFSEGAKNFGISRMLTLNKGETVDIFVSEGNLSGFYDWYAIFSGQLVYALDY